MSNTNKSASGPYNNTTCDREKCHMSKQAGTATLWCDACNELSICNGCGKANIDCGTTCSYECLASSHAQDAAIERRQMGIS